METLAQKIISKAGRAVRHWWLGLIAGILLVAGGIAVFCNPVESYLTLSIMFGILMLVTGIVELVVACTSRNYFALRGYSVAGGILDLLLGILLCIYPQMTLVLLPIMLGVYMLYHSFMLIGFGGDLQALGVPGTGWAVTAGILLLLLSIFVLINPFSFGIGAVIVLTGVSLIVMGISFTAASLRLRNIHSYFRSLGPDEQ
ncbi:MAG: DUF308 domain-containing protein [Bacteroidetes bacterium]|jgi:uncharacterized membrane protein HdeD (DUF308 family)|uniref:DUF308 domain-containing protein n=1 Tax=Candidatus Cryptobacteroides avicola TaxID=2840757 RepID=A0A940IHR2_9BACT|nr:DUF308 domain-containing protein [Candidatus Cryptobacteroides avicola]